MATLSSWTAAHPRATLFIVAAIVIVILCASAFLGVRALMKPKANRTPRARDTIAPLGSGFQHSTGLDPSRQRTPFIWPPYRDSYRPALAKKPETAEIARRIAEEAD